MRERLGKAKKIGSRRNRRGVVNVEYAMLLVVVAVPSIAALIAAGVKVVDDYTLTRNSVLHQGP
jgi:hypothetical protein